MKFLEEKFVPLAAALGSQRHLAAIRDAFVRNYASFNRRSSSGIS